MWRNHGDVEDRWTSITEIIDYYAANQELFAKYQSKRKLYITPDCAIMLADCFIDFFDDY